MKTYKQDTNIPLGSETQSGEDVGVWARGPMAHLSGTHEQSYIAHVMRYASCVGTNQEHYNKASSKGPIAFSIISSNTLSLVYFMFYYYSFGCLLKHGLHA